MWQSAHNTYMEERVLSAAPVELVGLLYQGAAAAVRDARRHLASGDILSRSRAVTKACELIGELAGALDFARGGDIALRLGRLYEYMLRRLTEANFGQVDKPLAEVLSLLATLSEGWTAIAAQTPPQREPQTAWTQPPVECAGAQAWSF